MVGEVTTTQKTQQIQYKKKIMYNKQILALHRSHKQTKPEINAARSSDENGQPSFVCRIQWQGIHSHSATQNHIQYSNKIDSTTTVPTDRPTVDYIFSVFIPKDRNGTNHRANRSRWPRQSFWRI